MQTTIIYTYTHAHEITEAITCEELSPPDNGEISVVPGPNSLSYGLRSVATYSCESGYWLVGQTTITCEDINGGTVTVGAWSGTPPHCQGITLLYIQTMCYVLCLYQWSIRPKLRSS